MASKIVATAWNATNPNRSKEQDDDPPPDDNDFDDPPPDDFDEDAPPDDDFFDDDPPPDDPDDNDDKDNDPPPDDDDFDDPPPDDDDFDDPPPDDDFDDISTSTSTSNSNSYSNSNEPVKKPPPPPVKMAPRESLTIDSSQHKTFLGHSTGSIHAQHHNSIHSILPTIDEDDNDPPMDDFVGEGFDRKRNSILNVFNTNNVLNSPPDDTPSVNSPPNIALESTTITSASKEPGRKSVVIHRHKSEVLPALSPDFVEMVAHGAATEGYLILQGKFEGDQFERLFVKTNDKAIKIRVESGHEIIFEFERKKIYVSADPDDSCCFVLDVEGTNIIMKTSSGADRTDIFETFPPCVWDVPVTISKNKKDSIDAAISAAHEAEITQKEELAANKKKASAYKYPSEENSSHKKGQSVEELLEGGGSHWGLTDPKIADNAESISSPVVKISLAKTEKILFNPSQFSHVDFSESKTKATYNRIELINSHIKAPHYSVRRAKQICKWINGQRIWYSEVTVSNIHTDFCNGLLLRNIMKNLQPDVSIPINEKPLTTQQALDNLNKVIGMILRAKHVNKSRIPQARDIVYGNSSKVIIMVQELFDVYVRAPLYARAVKVMRWFDTITKNYDISMPADIFSKGDLGGVWAAFQSGVTLFKTIYYFYGHSTIGEGANAVYVDPLQVFERPSSISEYRSNMAYIFSLFRALHIAVIWDPDDWITFPDTEFVFLQLSYVYDALCNRRSNLPPAQRGQPGITSGPNGSAAVVGLSFADTVISQVLPQYAKSVLMGSGEGSLPFLPVDITGRNPRFLSDICPVGLMSSRTKLALISTPLAVPEYNEKPRWNVGTKSDVASENKKDQPLLDIFKRQHHLQHAALTAESKDSDIESLSSYGGHEEQDEQDLIRTRKEIDDMMQALEDDIYKSEAGMRSLEEDLTTRYLELEPMNGVIGEQDYATKLDALESERYKLENEKERLQTHFGLRLKTIKACQVEFEAKMSSFESSDDRPKQSKGTSPAKSPSKYASPSSKSNVFRSDSSEKIKLAEKGWINSHIHPSTANFHLHKWRDDSRKKLLESWSPKVDKLKGKFRGAEMSPDRKSKTDSDVMASKLAEASNPVNAAFHSFLMKLNKVDQEWKGPRKIRPVDYTIYKERPPEAASKDKATELIPISTQKKSIRSKQTASSRHKEEDGINTIIRDENLYMMNVEDQRRKAWEFNLHAAAAASTPNGNKSRSPFYNPTFSPMSPSSTAPDLMYGSPFGKISGSGGGGSGSGFNSLNGSSGRSSNNNDNSSSNSNINNYNTSSGVVNNNSNDGDHNNGHNNEHAKSSSNNKINTATKNGTSSYNNRHFYDNSNISNSNFNYIESFTQSTQSFTQALTSDVDTPSPSKISSRVTISSTVSQKDERLEKDEDIDIDRTELSICFQWLRELRPLILSDRKSREYMFQVTESSEKRESTSNKTYSLVWRTSDSIAGELGLANIKDISISPHDSTTLLITILESPKALRLSGGRPSILLKCNSTGECVKYQSTLTMVLKAVTLGVL